MRQSVARQGSQLETVLVVEDDSDVRAYTVELLRELGYRVIEAQDGAAALNFLERPDRSVQLLLTDVVMPSMSGRELAEAARRANPSLRVLFMSGYPKGHHIGGRPSRAGNRPRAQTVLLCAAFDESQRIARSLTMPRGVLVSQLFRASWGVRPHPCGRSGADHPRLET